VGFIAILTRTHSHQDHAARSFLIAIVASAFGPMWLVAALWIWAPLVALARVSMACIIVSDVVAGTVLGVIVALIGLQIYQPNDQLVDCADRFSAW